MAVALEITDPAQTPAMAELQEGQTVSETVTITPEMFEAFIQVSRDQAPAHVDREHAARMGYSGCLVHGFLVGLPFSRLLGMFLPGGNTVIHQVQLEMLAPVHVGETLTYEVQVQRIIAAVKTVRLSLSVRNQAGVVVNRGYANCVFRIDQAVL